MDVRFYIQPDVNSAAGKRAAIKEFRDCLRCATCTERFPCPPNKQNIKEWERSGYGDPGFMRDFGYDRVKDSRCPMCGSEVSLGMFKLIFQGVLDEDDKLLRNEHGEVML